MSPKNAQNIAAYSVEWIVLNQEVLEQFLNISGCNASDLQFLIESDEFQVHVLEFLMTQDAWIIAFCDTFDIPYGDIARARAVLPGGDVPHWS